MHSTPVYEPECMHRFYPLDPMSFIPEEAVPAAFRMALTDYRHEDLRIIAYALQREDFRSSRLFILWRWHETARRAWNMHVVSFHCLREVDCIKMILSRIEEHALRIFRDEDISKTVEIKTNGQT